MKKVLVIFILACVVIMSACSSATWRGDFDDLLDRSRLHTPTLFDAKRLTSMMKAKTALDIMGKAHNVSIPGSGWQYNSMVLYWYLDDNAEVKAVFAFPEEAFQKEGFNDLTLIEQWVNYGYLASISIGDVETTTGTEALT